MPNHLHGIVVLGESGDRGTPWVANAGAKHSRMDAVSAANIDARMLRPYHYDVPSHNVPSDAGVAPLRSPPRGTGPGSLGAIVQNFKAVSTRKVNRLNGSPGAALWQRNCYEHVIRDEDSLNRIRAYVDSNPAQWELDQLHPDNPSKW